MLNLFIAVDPSKYRTWCVLFAFDAIAIISGALMHSVPRLLTAASSKSAATPKSPRTTSVGMIWAAVTVSESVSCGADGVVTASAAASFSDEIRQAMQNHG